MKVKHAKSGVIYECNLTEKQLKKKEDGWVMVQIEPKSNLQRQERQFSFKASLLKPVGN